MSSTPVVVIGAGEAERIPALVCEQTIKKHCPEAVIHQVFDLPNRPTRGLIDEGGKDPTNFSFVRFWLPELCERQGKAIYLDSDMILFTSISELFDLEMGDRLVLRHANPSVLLVDCERTPWNVREMMEKVTGQNNYGANMMTLGFLSPDKVGPIPDEWNSLDRYVEGHTKLLHYTDMNRQPWPNHRHPGSVPAHQWGHLWYDALADTLDAGLVELDDLHPAMLPHLEAATKRRQPCQ